VRRRGTAAWRRRSTSPPLMHGEFPWWWNASLRRWYCAPEIELVASSAPLEWEGERELASDMQWCFGRRLGGWRRYLWVHRI
jgi:hypothetical protein